MDTRPGELVAVDGAALALDEGALKHLTLLFHRIAVRGLPLLRSNVPPETAAFTKARVDLIDAGVFFEPDKNIPSPTVRETFELLLRDADEILKPTTGLLTKDFIAARGDEKKLAEFKDKMDKKSAAGQTDPEAFFEDRSLDPQRLLDIGKRLSNNLTRLFSTQLRQAANLDAYAVIPAEFSTLDHEDDDEGSNKHDVMKISLSSLPSPSFDVSWDQITEYRSDPESYNRFLDVKEWMADTARGKLTPVEIWEKLESLLDQYRRHFQIHRMNTVNGTLQAFNPTTADVLQNLATVRWGKAESIFSLQQRKVALLEEESKLEGSVVAFAMEAEIFDCQS